jgi:hypothetical protein
MGCSSSLPIEVNTLPSLDHVNSNNDDNGEAVEVEEAVDGLNSTGLVFAEAVDNSHNLFAAIKRGDIEIVKELIHHNELFSSSSSVKITAVNRLVGMWGSSPLIVAVQYRQEEIAQLLLEQPDIGNINQLNDKGASALVYSCMEGFEGIVRELLRNNATLTQTPTKEPVYCQSLDMSIRCSPLSIAIVNGFQGIVGLLIEKGIYVSSVFICSFTCALFCTFSVSPLHFYFPCSKTYF